MGRQRICPYNALDYGEAYDAFDQAITPDPNYGLAYGWFSVRLLGLNGLILLIRRVFSDDFNKAVNLNPSYAARLIGG
ncbi:MAG: hypothetical protein LUQ38_05020 [Methanotrichaceae archaeon]|nr:hypothetical protein [Methanotrichaceae archaeon]